MTKLLAAWVNLHQAFITAFEVLRLGVLDAKKCLTQ